MAVRTVDSSDRAGVKAFMRLEGELHRHPRFVANTAADQRKQLSGSAAITTGVASHLFVADGPGGPVARCSAWVNPRWQDANAAPDTGFIGHVALADGADADAAEAFGHAEDWLRDQGMKRVLGPVDGAPMLGVGARLRAFDEDPFFPIRWTPPRVAELFRAAGYETYCPYHLYTVDFSTETFAAASARALDHPTATVRPIDKSRWKAELDTYRAVFNEGFAGEWEFQQLTSAEFSELWGPLKPLVDPRWWMLAEVDGEPAGLCVSMPDWTPLWRSLKGRMGPLQILRLLRAAKRYERMGILAICLRPQFRGRGIAALMVAATYRNYVEAGLGSGVYYLVDDDNASSRRLVESFGGTSTVDYMAFSKAL